MKQLKSDNLWEFVLDSLVAPTPKGIKPVINRLGNTPNRFMTPENMTRTINAFTPYDLAMKPSDVPIEMPYTTSAVNLKGLGNIGIPSAILQSSQNPETQLSNFIGAEETAKGYPPEIQEYAPQGVYEHEVGHENDPRIDPSRAWSYPNHGYTTYSGLSGGLLQSEFPALIAEEKFMDFLNRMIYGQ